MEEHIPVFDTALFQTEHLYNIRNLPQKGTIGEKLYREFLINVVELCEYIRLNHKLILPNQAFDGEYDSFHGVIYRVGRLPLQFDDKYWPVGFNDEDPNELIFNHTSFTDEYIKKWDTGSEAFVMCREFSNAKNFLLLNFLDFSNYLMDITLLKLINKCIIKPIIYLHSVKLNYYRAINSNKTDDELIKLRNNTQAINLFNILDSSNDTIQDILYEDLKIKDMGGYSRVVKGKINSYSSKFTVFDLLKCWSEDRTRRSRYDADRLYLHYLGSVLDLVEQYMNHVDRSKQITVLGGFFPKIPIYLMSTEKFPSEVVIRKKMLLNADLRKEIFIKKIDQHEYCNSSLRIKDQVDEGYVLINKLEIQDIFDVHKQRWYQRPFLKTFRKSIRYIFGSKKNQSSGGAVGSINLFQAKSLPNKGITTDEAVLQNVSVKLHNKSKRNRNRKIAWEVKQSAQHTRRTESKKKAMNRLFSTSLPISSTSLPISSTSLPISSTSLTKMKMPMHHKTTLRRMRSARRQNRYVNDKELKDSGLFAPELFTNPSIIRLLKFYLGIDDD